MSFYQVFHLVLSKEDLYLLEDILELYVMQGRADKEQDRAKQMLRSLEIMRKEQKI